MMIPTIDIATRVYNHKWKIDPIVRSLIDTDFYKLLMCQSIFRNRPDTVVRFQLINRSIGIRLADLIDEGELREQLDHVRGLSLTRGESTRATQHEGAGQVNHVGLELRQGCRDGGGGHAHRQGINERDTHRGHTDNFEAQVVRHLFLEIACARSDHDRLVPLALQML